jgi:hypothetical protein
MGASGGDERAGDVEDCGEKPSNARKLVTVDFQSSRQVMG